jgi:hypothetical protein
MCPVVLEMPVSRSIPQPRRVVHIDPCAVIVEEAERRPAFGCYQQVAVITMVTGDKYTVEDGTRRVVREIAEAREAEVAKLTAFTPTRDEEDNDG